MKLEINLRTTYRDIAAELRYLWLWEVVIAGTAGRVRTEDPWFRSLLSAETKEITVRSWTDAIEVLKDFLWIEEVLNEPAENLVSGVLLESY